MNTEALMMRRIELLTTAVQHLSAALGARLSREELRKRLGVHRNTLAKRLAEPGFPQPGKDGKWLLEEIINWEKSQ